MSRILAINGSYRDDGITDQAVNVLVRQARDAGAEVEEVFLRDVPIDFCLNCRECTQCEGDKPGRCVLNDGMHNLIEKIEQADGFILAAPTNYGSVTALFKQFMERLTPYIYWPWGQLAPRYRKANLMNKKAIVVSSCAAPGFLGRLLYGSHRQLKMTAKLLGAKTVGGLFTGKVSQQPDTRVADQLDAKAQRLLPKLLAH